ncbi:hypothetical protein [Salmonella enterica]|uniref:hypothetical protein n=1 Tax=Salmonella enterica TaxID=28901 RepID=UPI00192CFC39|nr:hypothetical protein [Salmonella enterica]MBL6122542.1 hypothetical protein [Salmonella enterica subsp. enterica serovar Typhimurium]
MNVLAGLAPVANNLRSVKFCCAGSASVAAEFDHFITATIKHIFLKKFSLCHKSFITER